MRPADPRALEERISAEIVVGRQPNGNFQAVLTVRATAEREDVHEAKLDVILEVLRANTYAPSPSPPRELAMQILYAIEHGEPYRGRDAEVES